MGGLLLPAMAMSTAEAGGGSGGNKTHTQANRNTLVVAGSAPMGSTAGDTARRRSHGGVDGGPHRGHGGP